MSRAFRQNRPRLSSYSVRKQFICRRDGKIAGGAYMWESQEAAEAFIPDRGLRVFALDTAVNRESTTTRPLQLQTNLLVRLALWIDSGTFRHCANGPEC
jgi:hypothetical protein